MKKGVESAVFTTCEIAPEVGTLSAGKAKFTTAAWPWAAISSRQPTLAIPRCREKPAPFLVEASFVLVHSSKSGADLCLLFSGFWESHALV
jgi:hypothetical protein